MNRWTPTYRFYVGRHTIFLDDPAQAAAFFSEPQPFYVVLIKSLDEAPNDTEVVFRHDNVVVSA